MGTPKSSREGDSVQSAAAAETVLQEGPTVERAWSYDRTRDYVPLPWLIRAKLVYGRMSASWISSAMWAHTIMLVIRRIISWGWSCVKLANCSHQLNMPLWH